MRAAASWRHRNRDRQRLAAAQHRGGAAASRGARRSSLAAWPLYAASRGGGVA